MAINAALGGRIKRREDPRLITGAGLYTDDVRLEGCLHAVFVRSQVAHARLAGIDRSTAAAMTGVIGVFTAADFELAGTTARPPLAGGVVRFVGEAIAVAVAETREQAVDAAASVEIDYESLAVEVDPVHALEPGARPLHADKDDNNAAEFELGEPGALNGAEVVLRARFVNQRLAAVPMEANAIAVAPDKDGLRIWVSTQVPFAVRAAVVAELGLNEDQVVVVAPDVGGAFGAKLDPYGEQVIVAALAHRLKRPVRWFEYRTENMVAMTQGRAQFQEIALGVSRDGRLVGLEADIVADSGAYAGRGASLPLGTAMMSSGVYAIPAIHVRTRSAFTNTAILAAYRGAGRPEATAMVERAIDMLAAELNMDPAELRRRNLIRTFPHDTTLGPTYDSGDYVGALERALEACEYAALRRQQAGRRASGDRVQLGVGLCCYVEMTAPLQTSELASVSAQKDGSMVISVGTTSSGQGHETAFAQIASRVLDVPMERIRIVQSDTAHVARGEGTYGSRTLQLAGSSVRGACIKLVEKARVEAARRLEAEVDDVELFERGRFGVKGVPTSALTWAELAAQTTLAAEDEYEQDDQTYPFGCHVAVVEVDTETGDARLIRHVAVDDCGTILNPMLVEGQIHGGVAQGVAQALYEEFVYDDEGNPRTGTLTDYAIPSIGEIPQVETISMETPTPRNPLGAKGVGEAGTIGATPAVQNAVIDALSHLGVKHIDMPLHPMRVWEAIQAATRR